MSDSSLATEPAVDVNGGDWGDTARNFVRLHMSKFILLAVIAAIMAVTASQASEFLTWNNFKNILTSVAIIGILACGTTMIMVSGGIDLSIGSSVSAVGTAMALLMTNGGMDPVLAVGIGIAMAAFIGAINGTLAAFAKTHPFIITLGMLVALEGVALLLSQLPVAGLPTSFTSIAFNEILGLPSIVFAFFVLAIITQIVLKTTLFGRWLYAIGGSEPAARLAGIRVRWVKIAVYALSGVLVGIGAALLLAQLSSSSPQMGAGLELSVIAAVAVGGTPLVGGRGDMIGTFLGVILLGLIVNALTLMSIDPNLQYVLQGLVIIVAVMAQRDD
jgi:ribose/xylose/arabinose/galactoside ABC-type transport system permease subunit